MSPIWTPARTAACGARAPTRRTRCRTSRSARAAPSSTTACSSTASATSSSTSAWPRRSTRPTCLALQLPPRRHGGGHRRLDLRLRARHRGRRLSRGYRTIVPEECVADKHESPHFANLYDMALKYADVIPVAEVLDASEAAQMKRGSRPLRLPAVHGPAEDRVAERRAHRVLGGAEHRVLRARAAEESGAHVLAAAASPTCSAIPTATTATASASGA